MDWLRRFFTARDSRIDLIDVGSRGDLPTPWREHSHHIRHLLKFEPRDRPTARGRTTALNTALWESNADRDFYICVNGDGSSLFPQNYDYVAEHFQELCQRGNAELADSWFARSQLERIEKISCRTLDEVLEELSPPVAYHFLKSDTQGAEYQVLRGAERFLSKQCLGLHLELFEIPMYAGIHLLPEVVVFLDKRGFDLVKKIPVHSTFAAAFDCIFLKRGEKSPQMTILQEIYGL